MWCKHHNHLGKLARLACIRHAASVRPEPGSNSHFHFEMSFLALNDFFDLLSQIYFACELTSLSFGVIHPAHFAKLCSVFKVRKSSLTTYLFYHILSCFARTFLWFLSPSFFFFSTTVFYYTCSFLLCQQSFFRSFVVFLDSNNYTTLFLLFWQLLFCKYAHLILNIKFLLTYILK